MWALQYKNVVIEYRGGGDTKRAIDSFSLDVEEGEFLAFLGPNGAGKTSLISATSGLIPYQEGFVSVFGQPAGTEEAKRLLGVVPQELISHGFFTVQEILRFTVGYFGLRIQSKVLDALLDRLQLSSYRHKLVSQLSGGLKRRLLIAKALLHTPRVLLLDEPSAGVDVELRTILWDFISEMNKKGTTIVLTTHYLEEAQQLCKRSVMLNHGKLLAVDKTSTIIKSFLKLIRNENF